MPTGSFILEVAHAMPGRFRLRWIGNTPPPADFMARLRERLDVSLAEYRPLSRSLLIFTSNGFGLQDLRRIGDQFNVAVREPDEQSCAADSCDADNACNMVRIVHSSVPGRVRLRVPFIRADEDNARLLEAVLKNQDAVTGARASAITGSVLVTYEPLAIGPDDIVKLVSAFSDARPSKRTNRPESLSPAKDIYRIAATSEARDVLSNLTVSPSEGLSFDEVKRRALAAGTRMVDMRPRRQARQILLEQFVSVPTMMLGGAIAVSAFTAGWLDTAVIGAVLLINGLIGYFTERYAEGAIETLGRLGYPQAHVLRSGVRQTIPAAELVPGDIIRLRAGDLVPADARLIHGTLLTNESMLTGESEPVTKSAEPTANPDHIHEFRNIIFQGTAVVDGRARAVVLTTGVDTELGRIQASVAAAETPRTRLQDQLDRLGVTLGLGTLLVCGLLVIGGVLRRKPWLATLQMGVSLAVSAVPEGLPAISITALAVGMQRMLKRKVIIRKLTAVEALGSVTVLCVDKTGTLTLNQMAAHLFWSEGRTYRFETDADQCNGRFLLDDEIIDPETEPALSAMLRVSALCSETKLRAETNGDFHISGSATEGALLLAACSGGYWYDDLRGNYPVVEMYRREQNRPRMASVHRDPESGVRIAVKGAPDAVMELCSYRLDDQGKRVALTESDLARYRQANELLAREGLRVLAFAEGHRPDDSGDLLRDLTWLGLVGLHDPIRPGVAEATKRCLQAGVRVVILTGDQRGTARAVARSLGLANGHSPVLEAPDLDNMSPQEVAQTVERTAVFARVSPEDKLRIVCALQSAGHIVAMTGDGINDGPALKAADIGAAMGEGSSDVAKELADVVLTRNDFESLIAAVEQGRVIFANIRRALRYLVASNVSELMLSGAALIGGLPFPFHPIQILWMNLVSDIFPALALVLEPPSRNVMREPPRDPNTPLIGRGEWKGLSSDAGAMAAGALGTYLWAIRRYGAGEKASAAVFSTATIAEALYTLACTERAQTNAPRAAGYWPIWTSISSTIGLQFVLNHWAPLRNILHGASLSARDYGVVFAGAIVPAIWAAIRNLFASGSQQQLAPAMANGRPVRALPAKASSFPSTTTGVKEERIRQSI